MLYISPSVLAKEFENQRITKELIVRITHASIGCFSELRNESLITAIKKDPAHYSNYLKSSVGQYLDLHGDAVRASALLRLMFSTRDPIYKKLYEFESQTELVSDNMKALLVRIENKVELVPQSTTYLNFENSINSSFKRIENILNLDKNHDLDKINAEITKLIEHVNTVSQHPFGNKLELFNSFKKLSRDAFYDNTSMQSMVIAQLCHQCSAHWLHNLSTELLAVKTKGQTQIQSIIIKQINDKSLSDKELCQVTENTIETLYTTLEHQVRLYQGYYERLQQASADAIMVQSSTQAIAITCTDLPTYFKECFLLAEELSRYTSVLCTENFSKQGGLETYIRNTNLVNLMSPNPQGAAQIITQLSDRYPNYEFFIAVSTYNKHNSVALHLGEKYTSCHFRDIRKGNAKKYVTIAAIHKQCLTDYKIRYQNWDRKKRELYQNIEVKKEHSDLLASLLKQDPNYHKDFSIGYSLNSGQRYNYLGLIVKNEKGVISYEREVIKTPALTDIGIKSQLSSSNSNFYFSLSSGLRATTGALASAKSNQHWQYSPSLHVYPITEHTYSTLNA
ncbi:hypothetical protein [Pseudoalteromonas luteoviolacea]|uniref:hypothetical protein n=1 Tax=Pseudoalteromonas luteoviolacea TaxID=43657 RepID=UPI00114E36B7|nr:hypothetical protein [Pseudoalteromonas luteoviolacea]TQF70782.1 hypothetical protein FLM44_06750 [Pseudoalteromonas luteoviolacea]